MRRRSVLGLNLSDRQGEPVGTVVDTYPFDGGGEGELLVLRLGRLGERRMLPVAAVRRDAGGLRTPYARWQVEDSPALDEGRHAVEVPERAKSYWSSEEPAGSLTDRWQPSSGSSATAKRFPTNPSRTTIAS